MNNGITLSVILVMLGQIVTGLVSGSVVLIAQRRFFLHEDEGQSFAIPTVVSTFTSLCYFWLVISNGILG